MNIIPIPFGTHITIMTLSLVLFLIGILGFILNRKNIILMIISIEIMLLAVTLLALVDSNQFNDNLFLVRTMSRPLSSLLFGLVFILIAISPIAIYSLEFVNMLLDYLKLFIFTETDKLLAYNILKLVVSLLFLSYIHDVVKLLMDLGDGLSHYFTVYAAEGDTPNIPDPAPINKDPKITIPASIGGVLGAAAALKSISSRGGHIFSGMHPSMGYARFAAFLTVSATSIFSAGYMYRLIHAKTNNTMITATLPNQMPNISVTTSGGHSVTVGQSRPATTTRSGPTVDDLPALPVSKSSVVPTELIEWIWAHIVPTWVSEAYSVRVPQSLETLNGFSFIFTKYNNVVFVMNISMYLICASLITIVIVYYLPRIQPWTEKLYLIKYYFRFFIFNREYILGLNCFLILVNMFTIFLGITFMYDNYFPEGLGELCDANNNINKDSYD